MPDLKTGALTRDEIQAVWEGAVDGGYRDPLVQAGEGQGFEAWTQMFAQLERASQAIDVTTQAMFIAPWSGQSNPPAAGGAPATVTVTISRTLLTHRPLFLAAGTFVVLEQTTDFGPTAAQTVQTGRRYILQEDVFFAPGETGPFQIQAQADRFGYGYNNPRVDTLVAIEQIGSEFTNVLAEVDVSTNLVANIAGAASKVTIRTQNEPDMFVPQHQGQYLTFYGGLNTGVTARMVAFASPNPPLFGSSMTLELLDVVSLSPHSGTFLDGEFVKFTGGSTTYGKCVGYHNVGGSFKLGFIVINGDPANIALTSTVLGLTSGATGTIAFIDYQTTFTAEAPVGGSGGASWRVMDWVQEWGVTVTNAAQPAGGLAAMLDELGDERAVGRSPGEADDDYRVRVREIGEVVTPNAIKRIVNRAIPGLQWCLREAGQASLPGWFYDGDNEPTSVVGHGSTNDAYDFDTVTLTGTAVGSFDFQEPAVLEDGLLRIVMTGWVGKVTGGVTMTFIRRANPTPASFTGLRVRGLHSGATFTTITAGVDSPQFESKRFHVYLDYSEFRGFFIVAVPRLAYGEFGFCYDHGSSDVYDVPGAGVYDGFPRLAGDTYLRIWNAVEIARAGGVLWELSENDGTTCP